MAVAKAADLVTARNILVMPISIVTNGDKCQRSWQFNYRGMVTTLVRAINGALIQRKIQACIYYAAPSRSSLIRENATINRVPGER